MNSAIGKYYDAGNWPFDKKKDFWQHTCGLFQWYISGDNVSLCCAAPEFNEIIWPKFYSEKNPGG